MKGRGNGREDDKSERKRKEERIEIEKTERLERRADKESVRGREDEKIKEERKTGSERQGHRRRIDLEDKAKVVAYAWGAESLLR